jgi:hypothetical protein
MMLWKMNWPTHARRFATHIAIQRQLFEKSDDSDERLAQEYHLVG